MDTDKLNARLAGDELTGAGGSFRGCIPDIKCMDGTTLSVQTGETHYCSPRDNSGPWHAVEVGYPSIKPSDAMMEYCEDSDNPTNTVYGYVPINIVCDFINEHGGAA